MVGKLFRVIFSPKSRTRLREITNYHSEYASPSVARKVGRELRKEALKLDKLPSSKPIYPGTEDMDEEIRYTKRWSYKIIFQVLDPQLLVRVLTIRHDAEDPEEIEKDL